MLGLAAVGAGVTLTSSDGEEHSAVLTLLPDAIGLSRTVAWLGLVDTLVTYVLLLISLRARLRARGTPQDLVDRATPA